MKLDHAQAQVVLDRISIGNVHKNETHVGHVHYCGRENRSWGFTESALHNMHNVGFCRMCKQRHERGTTITLFEHSFRKKVRLRHDEVMAELRSIWKHAAAGEHVTLMCWCTPAPCHTNVIKQVLLELAVSEL